jgi:hypothetical protein
MKDNNKQTGVATEVAPQIVCRHILNDGKFVENHNLLLKALNQILADEDRCIAILGKDGAENFDGVTAIGQMYDGMLAVTVAYCAENYIEGEPDSMWSDDFVIDMKRIYGAYGEDNSSDKETAAEAGKSEIWSVCAPETPYLDYEVGKNNVVSIEERHIAVSSCAESQAQSTRLVYEVMLDNGWAIEIGADMKGLVVYRRKI